MVGDMGFALGSLGLSGVLSRGGRMRKCHVCNKVVKPFAEYWLREPDKFNGEGVAVDRGRALPFCCLGHIFVWAGSELRKQKRSITKQASKLIWIGRRMHEIEEAIG